MIDMNSDFGGGGQAQQSPAAQITQLYQTAQASEASQTAPVQTAQVFQELPKGFGSYLQGILPSDIAQGAGAFSTAMRQIKNISSIPIEKLAQVISNIETTAGLNQVGGSDVPVNTTLATQSTNIIALGSGPNGSYTMSDFLGAMSCLPYPVQAINSNISQLQTAKLTKIYQQLYLAVTWEPATFAVTTTTQAVETSPGVYDWQYKITGTTFVSQGGGYTRSGAADPGGTYTFSDGTPASSGGVLLTTNPDSDTSHVPGTYGRMINLQLSGTATWVTYATGQSSATPTSPGLQYRLPAPPIGYVSFPYTGGTNSAYGTAGWSTMNTTIQSLIDDANAEIASIAGTGASAVSNLNTAWNQVGTQLTIEQRARNTAMPAVQTPQSPQGMVPITLIGFIDLIPPLSQETAPHMAAQTLEAIADTATSGGQSIIAMMRQERNQARLQEVGINLDNNIPESTPLQIKTLLGNGTLPLNNGSGENTVPATLSVTQANPVTGMDETISPTPSGYYDPETNSYMTAPMAPTGDVTDPFAPEEPGTTLDVGQADVPGSLAGSVYQNLIPPNLSTSYTSGILSPATLSVPEAIDQVIRCNCDCWMQ
jgi:hypothetical protein